MISSLWWQSQKPVVAGRSQKPWPSGACRCRTIASCLVGSWSPPICSPNGPADDLLEGGGAFVLALEGSKEGQLGRLRVCNSRAGGRGSPGHRVVAAPSEQKGKSWGSEVWKEGLGWEGSGAQGVAGIGEGALSCHRGRLLASCSRTRGALS